MPRDIVDNSLADANCKEIRFGVIKIWLSVICDVVPRLAPLSLFESIFLLQVCL